MFHNREKSDGLIYLELCKWCYLQHKTLRKPASHHFLQLTREHKWCCCFLTSSKWINWPKDTRQTVNINYWGYRHPRETKHSLDWWQREHRRVPTCSFRTVENAAASFTEEENNNETTWKCQGRRHLWQLCCVCNILERLQSQVQHDTAQLCERNWDHVLAVTRSSLKGTWLLWSDPKHQRTQSSVTS